MINDEFVYASVPVTVSDIDLCRGPDPEGDKSGRGSELVSRREALLGLLLVTEVYSKFE